MKRKFLLFIVLNVLVVLSAYSQSNALPKIMYVTSKEGLRMRSTPSINGKIVGTLQYGKRVIVKSKNGIGTGDVISTIDGIYDYWYQLEKGNWVFGGYLSEVLPPDVPMCLVYGKMFHAQNYSFFLQITHFKEALLLRVALGMENGD
jgi:hypothetical protein